jgi:hypothetical protein
VAAARAGKACVTANYQWMQNLVCHARLKPTVAIREGTKKQSGK